MSDIVAEIKKIPPVTRFLVLSSLAVTAPAVLGLVPLHKLVFVTPLVTRRWELWRIYTSLFFGTMKLDYVFHLAMLYRSSNGLEHAHYERRSSDYAWQLLIASLSIIVLNRPFGSMVHDRALATCITYLTCMLSPPGAQTSIMGLVTVPVRYFPFALLAMDAIGGRASESLTGILVGHAWWWSVWGAGTGAGGVEQGRLAGLALAPGWLRDWFGERRGERRAANRDGYQVHAPRRAAQSAETRAAGGHRWGSGQRLGDR